MENKTITRGDINFHLIDCIEFMKSKPDNHYELAIIDPPYGINVNMNAGRKKGTRSKKKAIKKWDSAPPSDAYFEELFRISKNQIIWGANHLIDKIKINKPGWIFWDKCVAAGCTFSDGELAWTSFDQSLKKIVVPWSGFIGMEGEKFHPTTKPILLYRHLLAKYAKQGDKILDTHGGSMTHAIACDMEGFSLDICELDPDYFEAGLKAFDNYKQQLKLF